jgi:hypothetical protein
LYELLRDVHLPPSLEALRILTKLNHANLDVSAQQREVSQIAEQLARNHGSLSRIEIAYGTYWAGMYHAKWVRNRGRMSRGEGEGESLGTLDFEENIVFQNVNRMSEEGWEEVRERRRLGHVFSWLKRVLGRRHAGV